MAEKYSHARHIDKVLKASKARCAARAVLLEACRRAEFDRPETTFTKDQLQRSLGYTLKTIKAALQELRAEGSLAPIRHFEGGRGNAVTYRLQAIGQGGQDAAPEAGAGQAGGNDPEIMTAFRAAFQGIDAAAYGAWIKQLDFDRLEGGVMILRAPSQFIARYVEEKLGDKLRHVCANLPGEVQRIKVRA
jgi:hypothetical protein